MAVNDFHNFIFLLGRASQNDQQICPPMSNFRPHNKLDRAEQEQYFVEMTT